MSKTALKVVGRLVDPEFEKLDKKITEVIRDFVQLGELLIKMRDGQTYRSAGFDSFEDYCKSKAGLSIAYAKRTIRASMVATAITDNSGGTIVAPEILSHVTAISPIANFNTEKRKVETADGIERTVEQTVGIKNPTMVADQWVKTVKEFERRKTKAEKEGTKPPILSGKFVRNMLPNEYKVTPDRGFNCNPLVSLSNRLCKLEEWLDQNGCTKSAKLDKLVATEPPALTMQLNDLKNNAENVVESLGLMLELLDNYEEVDDA